MTKLTEKEKECAEVSELVEECKNGDVGFDLDNDEIKLLISHVFSESDYIRTSDLARIRIIMSIMRDIIPNKYVKEKERNIVGKLLWKWHDRLSASINTVGEGEKLYE